MSRVLVRLALVVAMLAACESTSTAPSGTGPDGSGSTAPTTDPAPSSSTSSSTSIAPARTTTTTISPATTAVITVTPTAPPTAPPTTPLPTSPPTTRPPGGPASTLVWRLPTTQRVVALTFDAGSDLGSTDQVLSTLAANGVRASFGITGAWADDHPDAVRRIANGGHQVINHSYSHRSFTGASRPGDPLLSTGQRHADLAAAESVLTALAGTTCRPFWRPPYGDTDHSVLVDAGSAGYPFTVMWTVDSGGWQGLTAEQIVDRVLTRASPGAIVAFHVGSASQDAVALQRIIDGLRAGGYSFVTLDEAYGT